MADCGGESAHEMLEAAEAQARRVLSGSDAKAIAEAHERLLLAQALQPTPEPSRWRPVMVLIPVSLALLGIVGLLSSFRVPSAEVALTATSSGIVLRGCSGVIVPIESTYVRVKEFSTDGMVRGLPTRFEVVRGGAYLTRLELKDADVEVRSVSATDAVIIVRGPATASVVGDADLSIDPDDGSLRDDWGFAQTSPATSTWIRVERADLIGDVEIRETRFVRTGAHDRTEEVVSVRTLQSAAVSFPAEAVERSLRELQPLEVFSFNGRTRLTLGTRANMSIQLDGAIEDVRSSTSILPTLLDRVQEGLALPAVSAFLVLWGVAWGLRDYLA